MVWGKRNSELGAYHVYLLTVILIYADCTQPAFLTATQQTQKFSSLQIVQLLTLKRGQKLASLHLNGGTVRDDGEAIILPRNINELVFHEIVELGRVSNVSLSAFQGMVQKLNKIEYVVNMLDFFSNHVLSAENSHSSSNFVAGIQKISSTSIIGSYVAMCIESFHQMEIFQYDSLIRDIQAPVFQNFMTNNVVYHSGFDSYIFKDNFTRAKLASYEVPACLYSHFFEEKEETKNPLKKINQFFKMMNVDRGEKAFHTSGNIIPNSREYEKCISLVDDLNSEDMAFLTNILDKQYIPAIEHVHNKLDTARDLNQLDNTLCTFAILDLYFGHFENAVAHLENTLYQARTLKNPELMNIAFIWIFTCMCEYPQIIEKFSITIEETIRSLQNFNTTYMIWLSKFYTKLVLYKLKSGKQCVGASLATYLGTCLINMELKPDELDDFQISNLFPNSIYQTASKLYGSLGCLDLSHAYMILKNTQCDDQLRGYGPGQSLQQKVNSGLLVRNNGLDQLEQMKYTGFKYTPRDECDSFKTGVFFNIINTAYYYLSLRDFDKLEPIFKYRNLQFLPYEFLRNVDMLYLEYLDALENYDEAIQYCDLKIEDCKHAYSDRVWEFEFLMKQIDIYIKCSGNSIARYLPKILKVIEAQNEYNDNYRTLVAFMKLVDALIKMGEQEMVLKLLNYNLQFFYRYTNTTLLSNLIQKYDDTIVTMCELFPSNQDVMNMFYYIRGKQFIKNNHS